MAHRYINASGDNYVTFKPTCLEDSACQNHCPTKNYEITTVTLSGTNQGVRVYWSDVEVLLKVSSNNFLTRDFIGGHHSYILD